MEGPRDESSRQVDVLSIIKMLNICYNVCENNCTNDILREASSIRAANRSRVTQACTGNGMLQNRYMLF